MGGLVDLIPLPYTDAVVVLGAAALGLCAGVLGAFTVLRQRSMVGDALSHAALPGVAVAFILTESKSMFILLIGAAAASLLGALAMVAIERTSRIKPDAAIGVVLSTAFSIGIVLLTYIASTGSANQAGLERYLFGQAAGLSENDVATMLILSLISVVTVFVLFRALKTALFDQGFASSTGLPQTAMDVLTTVLLVVAIVVGLRTVGAILMVAMIVTPVLTARQLVSRMSLLLPISGVLGAFIGTAGALLSIQAEVPTGPVIVLVGFTLVILAVLLAPQRGVIWNLLHRSRQRRRSATEGVLIDLETSLHAGPPPTVSDLALSTGRSERSVKRVLRRLETTSLLKQLDNGTVLLTESGAAAAHAALDERELWSAWLDYGAQIDLPDAREPDPRNLRTSLGDDAVKQLKQLATAGGQL